MKYLLVLLMLFFSTSAFAMNGGFDDPVQEQQTVLDEIPQDVINDAEEDEGMSEGVLIALITSLTGLGIAWLNIRGKKKD